MQQNAFEKTWLGEMLIEQIIEFESKVPGPLVVRIIFLKLVIFMTNKNLQRQIFECII